jgi:hypothetical protein
MFVMLLAEDNEERRGELTRGEGRAEEKGRDGSRRE